MPKAKRKKITKWLSDEAVKIAADERREVRNKGDDKEYRRLNAAFQRRARQDKEQSIKEKCRQIEESNKMGRTRDLYREIKEMTGSYSSRCGAMKAEHGESGNRREGGERNMAAIHGRTVQKGPKRNGLLQRKHILFIYFFIHYKPRGFYGTTCKTSIKVPVTQVSR